MPDILHRASILVSFWMSHLSDFFQDHLILNCHSELKRRICAQVETPRGPASSICLHRIPYIFLSVHVFSKMTPRYLQAVMTKWKDGKNGAVAQKIHRQKTRQPEFKE